MKRIAFIIAELSLKGTSISLYQYADYNETLLGNKSIIITQSIEDLSNNTDCSVETYAKFTDRFQVFYYKLNDDIEKIIRDENIEIAFIEKKSLIDDIYPTNCKKIIHNCYSTICKQGDLFLTVGESVNHLYLTNCPILPNIIDVVDTMEDLRGELNIPQEAIVFGRYGAYTSFNIPQVYLAIKGALDENTNIYFLFMNTRPFYKHERIIYLPGTTNDIYKRKFINTCDAMIHACFGGEAFGLAVGEFSVCKKPVITYANSLLREHLLILQDDVIKYNKLYELQYILVNFQKYSVEKCGYSKYTKEYVMSIFENYVNSL